MTPALITGHVLCLTGLITVMIALFLVPLVANQLCDLQSIAELPFPDDPLGGGEECTEVSIADFLAIFSVPGTLLLLLGSFVVVMTITNRIAYRRSEYRIKNN